MVSERVVISLVLGLITYGLMLTGIIYSESNWRKVCAYRFDLDVVFAGVVRISIIIMEKVMLTEWPGRFGINLEALICIHHGLTCVSGAVMILNLAFWTLEGNSSPELEKYFADYLFGFVVYLMFGLLILVGCGFGFCVKISNNKYLEAYRERRRSKNRIKNMMTQVYERPYSKDSKITSSFLLDTYGRLWKSDKFLRFMFSRYVKPVFCRRETYDYRETLASKCKICESLISKSHLYYQDSKNTDKIHFDCLLRSDLSNSNCLGVLRTCLSGDYLKHAPPGVSTNEGNSKLL